MCGIFGVMGNFLTDSEKNLFCDLLAISYLRGSDSTGVLALKHNHSVKKDEASIKYTVAKDTVDPFDFINSQRMTELRTGSPFLFLGHTRAATKGNVTVANAHPFVFPNVIGVHNGTLEGNYPFKNEYETDSEALYRLINDKGIEEALRELEDKSFPAYSLVYFDLSNGTLNFIRNSKRPMTIAWSAYENLLVFGSEYLLIDIMMKRRNMKFSDKPGNTPFSTEPGVLYTFKVGHPKDHESYTTKKFDFVKERPTYVAPECKVSYYPAAGGKTSETPFPTENPGPASTGGKKSKRRIEAAKKHRKTIVKIKQHSFEMYETYNGSMETEDAIKRHLSAGCSFCQQTSDFKDYTDGKITFLDKQGAYLCDACTSDEEILSQISFVPGNGLYT